MSENFNPTVPIVRPDVMAGADEGSEAPAINSTRDKP